MKKPHSLAVALLWATASSSLLAATVTWDGTPDMDWTGPSDATSWSGATYNDGDDAEFLGAGTGSVTIAGTVLPNSVTVNSAGGADYTLDGGAIGGASALTKNGGSRLFLESANTYTGVTTITGGQIRISDNDALGTTAGGTIIGNSTKLELDGGITIAEPITNQGGGGGKLTSISGTNTLTGLITLEGSIDLRGSDFVFQGGVTSANNSGFSINGSKYIIDTNPITIGTGGFGVTSAGNNPANATEVNVGGNDWGPTSINFGGYLKIGGDDYLPTDTELRYGWVRWEWSNGTLDLNGYDQTIRSISTWPGISVGLGGDHKVTGLAGDVLTINLDAGTTNNLYQGRFEGGLAVVKDGAGTLILENLSSTTAPAVNTDPSPGPAIPSSNTGSFTINAGVVESRAGYGSADAVNFSDTGAIIINGGTLDLQYSGTDVVNSLDLGSGPVADGVWGSVASGAPNTDPAFTGLGTLTVLSVLDVTWDGSTDSTWSSPDPTSWSGDTYFDAQNVSFLDAGAGTVTIATSVKPNSITINNTAGNDYSIGGGSIDGSTGLTKSGDGTLTLTGANTFTGDLVVNGGSLMIDGGGQLGGGTYSSTLTINNTSSFNWAGDNLQVFDGTVQGSGSGGILATGTGQLRFVFANNILFTGPVTVDGGAIQFRNTADLRSFSPKNLNVEGGGALAIQSSVGGNNRTVLNNKTWTFDNGGGTLTFNNGNHLFQGGGSTHNFDVTAAGSGSIIQSINGGFMNMQGSGVIELDIADGSEDRDLTLSATFNNGLIAKDGAGTLAITGAHNGSYNIAINAGTLEVGGAATLAGGSFTAGIANDGIYNHNSTADQTISGVISGTGTLVKDNAGTLTLSAVNTYTGDTTVSAGILSLGDGTNNTGLADAADVSVASGAVLDLNYVGTDTVDELILGGAQAGAGTWGATGSGATNINDTYFTGTGTLTVTTGGPAFDGWVLATGATNDPDANDDPDSFVNLLEFGFGTDPLVSDSTPLVADGSKNGAPIVQASGGGGGVTFEALFVRRDDYDTSGSATYTAQFSSDLVTFYDSSATPVFVADSTVDPDYEVVSVPYPATLPDGKKARFFRMKVDLVP